MPRQSRIDAPGALHQVMIRGIDRTAIFRTDEDRDSFLDRLGEILIGSSTPCYAWALLNNHAHFLLRTGRIPISRVMRKLLTGYAVTFNLRQAYSRNQRVIEPGLGVWSLASPQPEMDASRQSPPCLRTFPTEGADP